MSSEKTPEVVGCDASIMKNVWEIRRREYEQRMRLEEERLEKSALPTINKDWSDRMSAKIGKYKRVERKVKPSDSQTDDNIWKSKQPLGPQGVPLGRGSGPLGRPGFQARKGSSQASNLRGKKGQDKSFSRLQLLMSITQTQPSSLVWDKAWKFNKSLPSPAEGSRGSSDLGQCWMFAPYQPHSEEGKPWPNEPSQVDPQSYDLWTKKNYRMVEPQELYLNIPAEEWQTSWKRFEKIKRDSAEKNGNVSKNENENEILSSSEWSDSWMSTKPVDDGLMNGTAEYNKDMGSETFSEWEECWRLLNHHSSNSLKLTQYQKAHSSEWASSWRTAAAAALNRTDMSQNQYHGRAFNNYSLPVDGFQKSAFASHKTYLQFCDKFETINDWNKSWELIKNNSKPCAEIDEVLNTLPPRLDVETQKEQNNPQVDYSTERVDKRYEQLKDDVIHLKKKELPQSKLLLQHLQKIRPASEWRDSWKAIKHKMRQERRRYKQDPLKSFRESEKGDVLKSNATEWKDSWKFTSLPLNQNPELWQQGWSTSTQIRVNWERHQSEISLEKFPKNGPTSERIWGESWKFSRYKHQLEPEQGKEQLGKSKSSAPDNSRANKHNATSISDWQNAWMVTETGLNHDKPSFAEWREAWRWFFYHTPHWAEQVSTVRWVDETTEIKHPKSILSLERAKASMSRTFDSNVFVQRYPELEWSFSWSTKSLLGSQTSNGCSTQQQHPIGNEYGCKWGRSFRLANPMPQQDQPWTESSQNPGCYMVLWSRRNMTQNNNKSNLSKTIASSTYWANSYRFLQNPKAEFNNKSKSKEISDPRIILTKNIKMRRHLFFDIKEEKQSERKWAGCHLLGKTQPRPKKGRGSNNNPKPEDAVHKKFVDEWGESWRFLVCAETLKKQINLKPPSGWDESWKFLLPPYSLKGK